MDRETLKDILGEIDPAYLFSAEQQEIFIEKYLKKFLPDFIRELKESLANEFRYAKEEKENLMNYVDLSLKRNSKEFEGAKKSYEDKFNKMNSSHEFLISSLSSLKDSHEKSRKKDKGDFEEMLKKEIESQENKRDEKLKELAIQLKRIGFGGGSIPLIPTVEVPSDTVDGLNTIFTARYKPLFAEVSGQFMVSSSDDPINYGYDLTGTGPWTVTFVNPPAVDQTPHFIHI